MLSASSSGSTRGRRPGPSLSSWPPFFWLNMGKHGVQAAPEQGPPASSLTGATLGGPPGLTVLGVSGETDSMTADD